jgi:tetratricopeptide (TPR) repeat protein
VNLKLGNALFNTKQPEEAAGYYRVAVALRPDAAAAHYNLGLAQRDKQDREEAIAALRTAIELDPKFAAAHNNLGNALRAKQDLDGAIAAYRQAIDSDPRHASAHYNLGATLADKQDLDGAIAAYRQAIALAPKDALAHNNLGVALAAKGDLEGAIAAFRAAIALDPKLAKPHGALGRALLERGRFAEARTATRRSLDLLPQRDPLRQMASQQLGQCERLAALDEKLPAVLGGEAEHADAAERLALAQLCRQYKQRHAAAARFYANAFTTDPKLADDLHLQNRYNAACSAALAAAGQGEDAKHLSDKVRLGLRRQALGWLRDDLALYVKLAEREEPGARQVVPQTMQHWEQDADLASVRDQEALDKLPDDERQQWRQLWDDVGALLKKQEDKK